MVAINAGTHSRGRSGRSGEDVRIADGNSAPAASAFGASKGGGETSSVVVGFVSAGKPLLLSTGVGYRWADDRLWMVPGLAVGRPGRPEPA